jgi:hypothetical protein
VVDIAALFARDGRVEELDFDDDVLDHLAQRGFYPKHRVAVVEILQVHEGVPRYFANVGTGRAPIVIVEPTAAGRFLCVPIEPTGLRGTWRPVTAFEANAHHRTKYEGAP